MADDPADMPPPAEVVELPTPDDAPSPTLEAAPAAGETEQTPEDEVHTPVGNEEAPEAEPQAAEADTSAAEADTSAAEADTSAAEADTSAAEADTSAAEAAASAPAVSVPGEEQFYNAPQEHVTGQVDDLAKLTNLNPKTLLSEIQVRYAQDKIYTYVSDILIAVNPFKTLPIYGPETMIKYEGQPRHIVPPHVYALTDCAYNNLFTMEKNQCIVISGESGAGKTESAKIAINYIIELCRKRSETEATATGDLEEQILQVSPLLEAFGNAQTVMNDNSSRFGKYTRLYFDARGAAMGVEISEYLLEKSRVVEQGQGERNFHVFYYLFDSEQRERLHLTTPSDFDSLGGQLWGDNKGMLDDLEEALEVVGFADKDRASLYAMLGAILHLGNVQFDAEGEHSVIRDGPSLGYAAELMGVPQDELSRALLGFDTVTRGEAIRRLYSKSQSYDCRDALAKALYGSLFGWVVQNVNERLSPQLASLRRTGGRPGAAKRQAPTFEVGVLDIFGFENFDTNSFEQLCINVAHEQLQFFFNQHTFRLELEEYEQEGIDGNAITFRDNKPLLDMFLGRPLGVFSLLDEECAFPKATDASFVAKLDKHFAGHEAYEPAKMQRDFPSFAVHHFAADVEYNATNMIEKNRDNLAAGIVAVMQRSDLSLLSDVFNGEILPTGQIRAVRRSEEEARVRRGEVVAATSAAASPSSGAANTANRRAPSLSSQFKASLSALVAHMSACFPHFIRCIKPNYDQVPAKFVEDFVRTQLSYTGVLEATRIRQEGYSWRPSFAEFVRRYKLLAFPLTKLDLVKESESSAVKILQKAGLQNWKVGKTKLFLKFYHLDQLEDHVAAFYRNVVRTQSAVRAHFARKIFRRRQERARMSAMERAEAERREAEERALRRAEREAELAQEIEAQRLAREAAELQARSAEEDRRRQELEAMRAQADAERAQAEAERLNKLGEAEEARAQAEAQRAIAEQLAREREVARREADEARAAIERQKAELEALSRATEEARQQAAEAATEVKKQAFERTRSRKVRQKELEVRDREAQEQAELQRREAEEQRNAHEQALAEARAMAERQQAAAREELARMQQAADEAKRRAEEAAARALEIQQRAEQERAAEEARLEAERDRERAAKHAADFRRPDFSLLKRLRELGVSDIPAGVQVEDRRASGWLTKLGQFRKSWRQRWFVVDLDNMMLRYFASEASKKEKAIIPIQEVTRVFKPRTSSFSHVHNAASLGKHQNLIMIETLPRTYCLEAPSSEAMQVWLHILGIFTNPMIRDDIPI